MRCVIKIQTKLLNHTKGFTGGIGISIVASFAVVLLFGFRCGGPPCVILNKCTVFVSAHFFHTIEFR